MPGQKLKLSRGAVHVQDVGSGPVLLLVHGFPLDHTMWQAQCEGLSDQFRVIAPDLRGFGKSQVTRGCIRMRDYARDLSELLKALQIEEPVSLAGLSMGGYIAWQFWLHHGSQLERLILCDTRADADPPEVARARQLMADEVLREGAQLASERLLPRLTAEACDAQRVESLRQVILNTDPHGIAAAQLGMAQRDDFTTLLPQIQVPTLVVCGEDDQITPPDSMRRLAEALPRATFEPISQAGHLAPYEQPTKVNRVFRAFLMRDVFRE